MALPEAMVGIKADLATLIAAGERMDAALTEAVCEEIDGKVMAFLYCPIEGGRPYLWIDATYLKVRRGGCTVSPAAIMAGAVNTDGRHEVLGPQSGTSEAEPIWTEFLRKTHPARPARGQEGHLGRQ